MYEAPAGRPLDQLLGEQTLAPRDAVRLLQRLARALAPVHEAGGAHGALSAATIVIDEGGFPTVLTAGLGPAPAEPNPRDDLDAAIAVVAAAVGAPPSLDALARALVPGDPAPALAEPRSAEDLYALAERLEIALLATRPR